VPVALCGAVVGLTSLLQTITHRNEDFGLARRLEWMTFDWRARKAQGYPSPYAPNLGFVFINNDTIERVLSGDFGYKAGLYWPRHIYGRMLRELSTQGARTVGFDIIFGEVAPSA